MIVNLYKIYIKLGYITIPCTRHGFNKDCVMGKVEAIFAKWRKGRNNKNYKRKMKRQLHKLVRKDKWNNKYNIKYYTKGYDD